MCTRSCEENIWLLDKEDPDKKGFPTSIKSKRWKTSNDPDYDSKVRKILELYNNPPKDSVVVSIDEKGTMTEIMKVLHGESRLQRYLIDRRFRARQSLQLLMLLTLPRSFTGFQRRREHITLRDS